MLFPREILSLMMMGETPPKTGEGVSAGAGSEAGGTVAPNTSPGVPAPESDPKALSPSQAVIEDTVYYAVDPNRPDERFLGTQVKEAMHRVKTLNNVTGELDRTRNALKESNTERDALRAQMDEITANMRLQKQLSEMQVQPQQRGTSQLSSQQQQQSDDAWLLGNDLAGNPPAQIPAYLTDPAQFRQFLQEAVSTEMDQRGMTQDGYKQQLAEYQAGSEEERAARDQTSRTLRQSRELASEGLRNIGVEETEIARILDMEQQSSLKHREAELLMSVTGVTPAERAQSFELGQLALTEAQQLLTAASTARAKAMNDWNAGKAKRDAELLLENDAYVGPIMEGMTTGDPDAVREMDGRKAAVINKTTLDKAKEIAAEQRRIREAASVL
jgi:hypothetical protein